MRHCILSMMMRIRNVQLRREDSFYCATTKALVHMPSYRTLWKAAQSFGLVCLIVSLVLGHGRAHRELDVIVPNHACRQNEAICLCVRRVHRVGPRCLPIRGIQGWVIYSDPKTARWPFPSSRVAFPSNRNRVLHPRAAEG